ncbi:hypothetical protein [Daejeonella oryzae]|uniref:hypothetical protein n=1 Tax=Daejeonella oryzae TaxID=1122943 RepID=UPI0004152294|nr:hypothetical protein [Daejeonella oryzae]
MHFGKIVRDYNYSQGLSAADLSVMLGITVSEILNLFEKKAWNITNINAVSAAYNHDFLQYLERSIHFQNR